MLLSVTISVSLGRSLLPWTIIEMNDNAFTFEALFTCIQGGRFDAVTITDDLKRARLVRSLVGQQRDELMATSNGLSVLEVCREFGKFVQFSVELSSQQTSAGAEPMLVPNAFAVMTAAQRRLQVGDNGLPFPEQVKDGRDRMYNDLLCLMREMGISWNAPTVYGTPFLKKLRDCLWYVDGRHDRIAEKALKFPELFARFTGYNCPEAHKHRKRGRGNLSMTQLRTHSLTLQECLQSSWFKKEHFKGLKEATESIVCSLSTYSAYLVEKNKSQKLHHLLNSPAASPCDSSHLEHLPRQLRLQSSLKPIDERVKSQEPYTPVDVADFSPTDRRQRYRYMENTALFYIVG